MGKGSFFFYVSLHEEVKTLPFLMLPLAGLVMLLEPEFRWHFQGTTSSKGEIGKELLPLAAMGSE